MARPAICAPGTRVRAVSVHSARAGPASEEAWHYCMSDLHGLCEAVHTSGETLVERCPSGFHDRWPLCPTHTTCSTAVFASVPPSSDAMKGSVSARGADVFCRAEIPLGVCDWCGRVSARMSKGQKQKQTAARDVERSQPE